ILGTGFLFLGIIVAHGSLPFASHKCRPAAQNCSTSITGVTRKSPNSVQDFAALVTSDSSSLSTSAKTTSAFLPIQAPRKVTPGLRLGPCCSKAWTALSLLPGWTENSTINFTKHLGVWSADIVRL